MRRQTWTVVLLAIWVTGCTSTSRDRLTVTVINGSQISVGGWVMLDKDLASVLQERKPASVTIDGVKGAPYERAQELQRRISDCGIKQVVIADANKRGE